MRCYKGLAAYNQFVCGWVRDVMVYKCSSKQKVSIIRGRVMHSQRLNDTALSPWIIAENTGDIKAAHCNCMAGLGEVCTHIASLLFYVESAVRLREQSTVTGSFPYWKLPESKKSVTYAKLNDIDFTSAKTKKRKLDESFHSQVNTPSTSGETPSVETPSKRKLKAVPSKEEYDIFFEAMQKSGDKPVFLSVKREYQQPYKPMVLNTKYPLILSALCQGESMSFSETAKECEKFLKEFNITEVEVRNVERDTRDQSKSKLWHEFRIGRITASKMKRVCRTAVSNPSLSLIKEICYPANFKFTSNATKWGLDHESVARDSYFDKIRDEHTRLQISDSGLLLCQKYPFMGASPDGLVSCECCGNGVVEIKCPFSLKDKILNADLNKLNLSACECFDFKGNSVSLKKTHEYYYQIQTQMLVTDSKYADFVVWTQADIHIERILPDETFLEELCFKSKLFFEEVLLFELISKEFTRRALTPKNVEIDKNIQNSDKNIDNSELFCTCRQPEKLPMVMCDNQNCKYVWFHFACVNLDIAPKGKWHCIDCRK